MEVEGLGDWVMWLWLKKLCSSIFSNMVEASMLREASVDVRQYMVSTPTSTDDPREVRATTPMMLGRRLFGART